MKICWDNLENIRLTKNGNFRDFVKKVNYIYKTNCKQCGEPFLAYAYKESKFCCKNCVNVFWQGKIFSDNIRKNMSRGQKNKIFTKEHRKNLAKAQTDKHHLKGTIKKLSGKNSSSWKGGVTKRNIPLYDTYASQIDWCEEVRRNKEDPNILEVRCTYCGGWLIPNISSVYRRIFSINDKRTGENRFYCSKECKQECSIYNQRKWPKGFKINTSREVQPELRKLVLERDEYQCVKCGSKGHLHCHHITGIEINPIESADINNCVTLCKQCHNKVHKLKECNMRRGKCK